MLLSFSYSFAVSLLLGARHHTNYSFLPRFYAICTKYFALVRFFSFFLVNRFISLLYMSQHRSCEFTYISRLMYLYFSSSHHSFVIFLSFSIFNHLIIIPFYILKHNLIPSMCILFGNCNAELNTRPHTTVLLGASAKKGRQNTK